MGICWLMLIYIIHHCVIDGTDDHDQMQDSGEGENLWSGTRNPLCIWRLSLCSRQGSHDDNDKYTILILGSHNDDNDEYTEKNNAGQDSADSLIPIQVNNCQTKNTKCLSQRNKMIATKEKNDCHKEQNDRH